MADWICYKSGPFYSFPRFFIEILKFWKWKKMKKSWILFSIRQYFKRNFYGFTDKYNEFEYFKLKYSKELKSGKNNL